MIKKGSKSDIIAQTTLSGSKDKKESDDQPIAHKLAEKQREISVAEFFEKNRHLLGFDNKKKAILTAIKEAVDNSLDACEEARVLPEISVEIIDMQNDRYRIIVEDNGPGIVKKQIPNIFARLLYGSKFHSMKQSRGQQGIGISAAALYGQLTTGRPIKIVSRIAKDHPAHYYELRINTQNNMPEILKEGEAPFSRDHGTRIELDLEATYSSGPQSVAAYMKQTAIVNPHATLIFTNPKAEQIIFARATEELPKEPKEIKPHPYGIEVGMLIKMLSNTESRTLQSFLTNDFSRVSSTVAKEICDAAEVLPNFKPSEVTRDQAERMIQAIRKTKIMAPPTDCISPIGEELLEKGLKKEINAEFYCATSRSPDVYRGNPFQVEAAIAYGGDLPADKPVRIMRFANRVPLLYQQSACAINESMIETGWRAYGLSQSQDSLPVGPAVIVVHIASVWAPFTSEAKEAIAHYPEIIKEVKLALQECGRKLAQYTLKKRKYTDELKKRGYIEKYIPFVAQVLKEMLSLKKENEEAIKTGLKEILEKKRGKLEDVSMENEEYDEDFAKIGADDSSEKSDEEEGDDGEDDGKKSDSGHKGKPSKREK